MTEPNDSAGPVAPYGDEPRIRPQEYWWILVRRRFVVLGCLTVVVATVMTLTLFTAPKYRATTTIEIQRYSPEVVEFTDVVSVDPSAYWDFHETQQKILQSRTVARLAAEQLDLSNRPEFASRKGSPLGRLARWVRSMFPEAAARADEQEEDARAPSVDYVQGGVTISLIRNSYLVNVSFEDRHPRLAADVANAVADAYQRFLLDARYTTTGQAREFLTKDVARVQAEISTLESELQSYGVEKEILALSDGTRDISEEALADINRRYTEAASRLASTRARHLGLESAPPEALPEVLASPIVSHLRQRHAEIEREHTQMAERFKADWPPLAQLGEQLAQARRQLAGEAENIAVHVRAAARAAYEQARAEFAAIAEQRETQKREVQRVNHDAIDYASLKTAIETKRKVLSGLVQRESETETSYRLSQTGTSNVRVVDRAELPQWPVSPNKRLNLLLAILSGLGAGAGLALLADHLDNTIKTEQDIVRLTPIPVLGHLPLTRRTGVVAQETANGPTCELDLASHADPRSHFVETFRNLRTSLLLAAPDHPPRHVLVTSCEPGDGKSTVALNLAIVLTQLGRRILLVDADLRRPRIHKTLALDNALGLSSYLSGNADLADVLQETAVPNLRAIPSGPIPPNPSELLGSPRLDALLEDAGFDHLILDSPPLLSVADSIVLSARTDSTTLVVRSGSTRREALVQSARRLRQARANVTGIVLNAMPEDSDPYYRTYWYRRHYGAKAEPAPEQGLEQPKQRRQTG